MLDLNNLTAGDNPGLTVEKGAGLAQAGAVCLEKRGHNRTRKSTPQYPTGFDYWLGDDNTACMSDAERAATESLASFLGDEKLVARAMLEVSGIRKADDRTIRARVRRKLRQMNRSDALGLPAYAIVVEFGRPLAEVVRK